jgi:hypothetical protein
VQESGSGPDCVCRVGPGNFTPSPSQIPDVILSHHPARVITRRLPPCTEPAGSSRYDPSWPKLNGDDLPPWLHEHYTRFTATTRQSAPLRRIGTFGLAVGAACALYGFLLSSGFRAAISLSCFLDRFLCSIWNLVPSPRPAILQCRRAQELSRLAVAPTFPRCSALARPYLDSSEHGGTLDAVGMTTRGEPAFGRADQSSPQKTSRPSEVENPA